MKRLSILTLSMVALAGFMASPCGQPARTSSSVAQAALTLMAR